MSYTSLKNEKISRTLDPDRKHVSQSPLGTILQAYQDRTQTFLAASKGSARQSISPLTQTTKVIQRAPEDFSKFAKSGTNINYYEEIPWDDDSWIDLLDMMKKYGTEVPVENTKRKSYCEEIRLLAEACKTTQKTRQTARNGDDKIILFCEIVEGMVVEELEEIENTKGMLQMPISRDLPEIKQDPQITKSKAGDTPPHEGICKEDTPIVNEYGQPYPNLTKHRGDVVQILDWSYPDDAIVKKETHVRIESSDVLYFVEKDKLFIVNQTKAVRRAQYIEKVDPDKYPLFPHIPTVEDIHQGRLGDCYLLSAMVSVVHKDPTFFMSHMVDNLDGTICVNLYDDQGSPVIVKIKKSIPGIRHIFSTEEIFAHGALWVSLYEKAYVAAGFWGSPGDLPIEQKSYGWISGGEAQVALQHITGIKPIQYTTKASLVEPTMALLMDQELRKQIDTSDPHHVMPLPDYSKIQEYILSIQPLLTPIQEAASISFFSYTELEAFLKQQSKTISPDETENYQNACRWLIQLPGLNQALPGPLGSGLYTPEQLELFDNIKTAIDENKLLTVSIKKEIYNDPKEIDPEAGFSGGENKVKGLVGPHGYAILDYRPKGNTIAIGTPHAILLRNPWGHLGRIYTKAGVEVDMNHDYQGAERQADPRPEFWLDLAELNAYSSQITECSWLADTSQPRLPEE